MWQISLFFPQSQSLLTMNWPRPAFGGSHRVRRHVLAGHGPSDSRASVIREGGKKSRNDRQCMTRPIWRTKSRNTEAWCWLVLLYTTQLEGRSGYLRLRVPVLTPRKTQSWKKNKAPYITTSIETIGSHSALMYCTVSKISLMWQIPLIIILNLADHYKTDHKSLLFASSINFFCITLLFYCQIQKLTFLFKFWILIWQL